MKQRIEVSENSSMMTFTVVVVVMMHQGGAQTGYWPLRVKYLSDISKMCSRYGGIFNDDY